MRSSSLLLASTISLFAFACSTSEEPAPAKVSDVAATSSASSNLQLLCRCDQGAFYCDPSILPNWEEDGTINTSGCPAAERLVVPGEACSPEAVCPGDSGGTGVRGRLLFAAPPTNLAYPVTAVIRVLDTTLADAPAVEVASQRVRLNGFLPQAFAIPVAKVDPRVRYTVSAKIDADFDEATSTGDWITMESYPVFNGYASTVDVQVKLVE